MGKGDRRTKRGKIWRSSFGNSRPARVANTNGSTATAEKPVAESKEKKAK